MHGFLIISDSCSTHRTRGFATGLVQPVSTSHVPVILPGDSQKQPVAKAADVHDVPGFPNREVGIPASEFRAAAPETMKSGTGTPAAHATTTQHEPVRQHKPVEVPGRSSIQKVDEEGTRSKSQDLPGRFAFIDRSILLLL
jgi:hypothetical protein